MYRSIVVPLDGSTFGERALPLALAIARRAKADLQVVQVHVSPLPGYADTMWTFDNKLEEMQKQPKRAYLNRLEKRLADLKDVKISSALLDGPVVETLLEWASARDADLVVMSTHGFGPLARGWLGSVADELVRRLPVPVLLVRPQETEHDGTSEPEVKHVLIPLDGSPLAEKIVEPAVALGAPSGAKFTLLRVVPPLMPHLYDPATLVAADNAHSLVEKLAEFHEQDKAEAQQYLEKVASGLRARSLRVQTRIVVHDQPAVAILEEAKGYRPDVIALATRGRSGIRRLLLGSVADKIVRAASVAVLVHHPQ